MPEEVDTTRFERTGGPPDLPAAFSAFIVEHLNGRCLDDHHSAESAEGEFPDFACFQDLVLIEMKHLETDQHKRINDVFEEKIEPNEFPLFGGDRPAHFILDRISNADAVKAAVFSKLARTIEGILRKANRQFIGYRGRNSRKNSVNICVLLNSRLIEYTPEVVCKAIHSKMGAGHSDKPRYAQIDAVLYFSEKHFLKLPDGKPAHPVVIYEGLGAVMHEWKFAVIKRVVDSWSKYRTGATPEIGDVEKVFAAVGTVEDIPANMSRSDMWLLEYSRNPYLKNFSVEQLRTHFQRQMALNSLAFHKGSWPKPSNKAIAVGLRRFQHVIAETNRRGVDLRELDQKYLTSSERAAVFADLPEELIAIIRE